jgi:hypothetical protein
MGCSRGVSTLTYFGSLGSCHMPTSQPSTCLMHHSTPLVFFRPPMVHACTTAAPLSAMAVQSVSRHCCGTATCHEPTLQPSNHSCLWWVWLSRQQPTAQACPAAAPVLLPLYCCPCAAAPPTGVAGQSVPGDCCGAIRGHEPAGQALGGCQTLCSPTCSSGEMQRWN